MSRQDRALVLLALLLNTFVFVAGRPNPVQLGSLLFLVRLDVAEAQEGPPGSPSPKRVGPDYVYPPKDIPGVRSPSISQENINETICNVQWSTKAIRPPVSYTSELKLRLLARPEVIDKNASHYMVDHLIPLELGGHPTDPKNLWLQMWGDPQHPRTSAGPFSTEIVGGVKAKDEVENYLHTQVCAGKMTLEKAQEAITTDWYRVLKEKN